MKWRLARAPVDQQVLGQVGGDGHPHPVVHPALGEQLAHAGVDPGDAGLPCLPRVERLGVVPPGHAAKALVVLLGPVGGQAADHVEPEVAPGELPAQRLGAVAALPHQPRFELASRDRAEVKAGGEPRRRVEPRQVADLGVVGSRVRRPGASDSGREPRRVPRPRRSAWPRVDFHVVLRTALGRPRARSAPVARRACAARDAVATAARRARLGRTGVKTRTDCRRRSAILGGLGAGDPGGRPVRPGRQRARTRPVGRGSGA